MIHGCFLFSDGCSWVPCLFRTVKLSTVLQNNPPWPRNLQFSSIFCIFEPFPAVTVWFWDPSSHTEDDWGTQTTIKKRSNIHRCSRKKPDALRDGRMSKFFLFCRNIIFFPFITALWKQQKLFACFPEDKLSTIYLDPQIQKVFTPWLLMLQTKGSQTFEWGYLNNFSFFVWNKCKHILCKIFYSGVRTVLNKK